MKKSKKEINEIGNDHEAKPAYIIAEMACAHEGKYEIARCLVDAAAQAGANAIQFQIFNPKEYIHPDDPDYELIKRLALLPEQWVKLFEQARRNSLDIVVAAYDPQSVKLSESQDVDAYKVHSADLNNPWLLDSLAPLNKPIHLSVGGSLWVEIQKGIDNITRYGNKKISLMYGVQNFPTPFQHVYLNSMVELKHKFNLPVGYQDHTDGDSVWGFWIPIMSLCLGVRILEKHITHNRSKKGIDHQAALNPDEFREFVKLVKNAESILGRDKVDIFDNLNEEAMKFHGDEI